MAFTDIDGVAVGTYTAKLVRFGAPQKSTFGDGKAYRYVDFEVVGGDYAGEKVSTGIGVDLIADGSKYGPGSKEFQMVAALVSPKTPFQFQDEMISEGEDLSDENLYARLMGMKCVVEATPNKAKKITISKFTPLRTKAVKTVAATSLDDA